MPERRSRPRASGAEFRGGGAARHWGDPDALERQALLDALNADDEIVRGEMPLSPGSVLGVARRIPEWLRRLRRGLTPKTGASTAPTGNVLQTTVLSDKPAQMSRRSFFLDPVQMLADIPESLEEIGRPKGIDKRPGGRDDPRMKAHPDSAAFEDALRDMNRGHLRHWMWRKDWQRRPVETIQYYSPEGRRTLLSEEFENPRSPQSFHRVEETLDQLDAAISDRPGILGDIETVGRSWADQALKETAEKAGKSYEEAQADVRRRQEEPGPVAQAAAGVRRRFGRRRRK